MLVSAEHERLVRMLKESISLMCKSSLNYGMELNVEGLLGITLDKKSVVLVNIHESFQSPVQQDRPRPTAPGLLQSVPVRKDEDLKDNLIEIKTERVSDDVWQCTRDGLPTPLEIHQKPSEDIDFGVIRNVLNIKEEIDDIVIEEEDDICVVEGKLVGQTSFTTPADDTHGDGTEKCMLVHVSMESTEDAQRESQIGTKSRKWNKEAIKNSDHHEFQLVENNMKLPTYTSHKYPAKCDDTSQSRESGKASPKLFRCTVANCQYRTTLRCDMQRHLEMHGRHLQNVNKQNSGVRYPRQLPARWQCTYPRCHYRTASTYNFRRHQRIHTGDYLNCEQCGQKYPDEYELKEHIRLLHRGEGRCQHCNKTFTNRSSWVRHQTRAHCKTLVT